MNLIEFIGFIISFLIFLILIIRRTYERWKKLKFPEQDEEKEEGDQQQQLKDFLESLDVDMEEIEEQKKRPMPVVTPPPPPVEKPAPKRLKPVGALATSVDKRTLHTKVEKRQLETKIEDRFTDVTVVSSHFRDQPEIDPYKIKKASKRSSAFQLLHQLKNPQAMVVLYEILSPPKSMR